MLDKLKKYSMLLIWLLLSLFLIIILILSFKTINGEASQIQNYTEHLTVVLLCGTFLFGILMIVLCRFIMNVNEKYVRWISLSLIAVFVILEFFMLHMFYVVPITDGYVIEDNAMSLLQGINSTIDEYHWYFERYGNNYFLVLVMKWLFSIMFKFGWDDPYAFLDIINVMCLVITLILFWLSAKIVVGERKACISLLFFVINPVFYGLTFWTYSLTMSMPIMLGITYLGLLLFHSKNTILNVFIGITMGILVICGYSLRPTAMFPFIALIIVGIYHIRKCRLHIRKLLVVSVLCIISAFLSESFIQNRIDLYTDNTDGNLPLTHWVMMGMGGDGSFNSEDEQFSISFDTTEEIQEANIQTIKERARDLGVTGLVKLWIKKLETTWADGTHGFTTRLKQDTMFTKLYTYMVDGKTDAIALYSQIFQIFVFLGAIIACLNQILKREWNAEIQLIGITILGGIIFYLLWEAKNVYSVPFLPFVYILGAQGWCSLPYEKISSLKAIKVGYGMTSFVVVILTIMAGFSQFQNYTGINQTFKQYSVRTYGPEFCLQIKDCSLSDKELIQTFYTDKTFNSIYIKASVLEPNLNTAYQITLKSGNSVIAKESLNANSIQSDGYVKLRFDNIIPNHKEKYTISIEAEDPGTPDSIQWWYHRSNTMDNYEGVLTIDGIEQQFDLFISVLEEYSASYTSVSHYVIIILSLLMTEIIVLSLAYNKLFSTFKRRKRIRG